MLYHVPNKCMDQVGSPRLETLVVGDDGTISGASGGIVVWDTGG